MLGEVGLTTFVSPSHLEVNFNHSVKEGSSVVLSNLPISWIAYGRKKSCFSVHKSIYILGSQPSARNKPLFKMI